MTVPSNLASNISSKVDDEERLEYILSKSKVYAPDIPKPEINRRHMVTKPKDGFEIEDIMKRLEYNGSVVLFLPK